MAYKKYKDSNSIYDIRVRMYAFLIYLGRKTIDDVPAAFKDDVAEYVKENYTL